MAYQRCHATLSFQPFLFPCTMRQVGCLAVGSVKHTSPADLVPRDGVCHSSYDTSRITLFIRNVFNTKLLFAAICATVYTKSGLVR